MTTTAQQAYCSSISLNRALQGSGTIGFYHGLARVGRVVQRQRQRRALLDFDDRMLEDIGISRAEALEEGRKPFWK